MWLALQAACAPGLAQLYRSTDRMTDWESNLAVTESFPPASGGGLVLNPEAARWVAQHSVARPFVRADKQLPSAEVARAVSEITRWQSESHGRRDQQLEPLWPDLDPIATTELKLAIERGNDDWTLHYLFAQDLQSEAARARLLEVIRKKAEERLAASQGAPVFTIINTDVDDTTFASLWDRGRYPRGEPYPGYLELLAAQGQFLTILTARPSLRGLFSQLTREKFYGYFQATGLDPARVDISVAPGELGDMVDSLEMGLIKAESLLLQRQLFPEAASVFNGDSGQGDWIAALIVRRLDPTGLPYATINDVRPWSPHHRKAMLRALASSQRLERIYRRALGLPDGALDADAQSRLSGAVATLRKDVDSALAGPHGRLDGPFMRERGIFLYRNVVDLALDLAAAHLLSDEAADRIVAVAARSLRFLPPNEFAFDQGDPERIATRIAVRAHLQP